jgi:hypothetical protein
MNKEDINIIPIEDLVGPEKKYSFLIPSYQRGYRWTEDNIKSLLKDLWEFMESPRENDDFYCLQPVVVQETQWKDVNNTVSGYELIDGQQRLTTIYILLKILKEYLPKSDAPFELSYQTRKESKKFLEELNSELDHTYINSNIDFSHIYNAFITAKEWLENKRSKDVSSRFNDLLLSKVCIIWYEVTDQNVKAKEVFTRINVGKIGLTNAELIKALFLQGDKWKSKTTEGEEDSSTVFLNQIKIATAWDKIETYLREDDFWYFLRNKTDEDKYKFNRIEYIFDLIAEKKSDNNDDFFTFIQFSNMFEENKERKANKLMEEIWERIENYFMTFREWFEDPELYHRIGFLISSGAKIEDIKTNSKEKAKPQFIELLDNQIKEKIALPNGRNLEDLIYTDKNDYKKLMNILLLFNIQAILKTDSIRLRFPFDLYKKNKWSLEHIHAQNAEALKRHSEQLEWLKDNLNSLKLIQTSQFSSNDIKELIATVEQAIEGLNSTKQALTNFDDISAKIITKLSSKKEIDNVHSIGNLALLDGKSNSSLSNSVFLTKKAKLIELENQGSFIPICTRNVFMKYYNPKSSNLFYWSSEDMNTYVAEIKKALENYLN